LFMSSRTISSDGVDDVRADLRKSGMFCCADVVAALTISRVRTMNERLRIIYLEEMPIGSIGLVGSRCKSTAYSILSLT
jgi:hypothetical protein